VTRVRLFVSIGIVVLLAVALSSGPAAAESPATVPVGVTVGGVQVGGLTPEAASTAVQQAFQAPLELLLGTTHVLVTPDLLGASAGIDAALHQALAAPENSAIALSVTVNNQKTAAFVAGLARRYDRRATSSQLSLRQLRPWLSKERPGHLLEQRRAIRDITAALVAGVRDPVQLTQRILRPSVTRRSFGPVIVIRRRSNRLLLYSGMSLRRAFGVATGQRQYPTPLGRFRIVVKWMNPWWYPPDSPWAQGEQPVPPGPDNPLGTRWMGLSAPGVGIHGTPSDTSIGYSVSHGCIRMHIPEAEWLFGHVKIGTTVFIVAA
jgi:lipoprotein-anchoring transpeptidase ErfK/SrfK